MKVSILIILLFTLQQTTAAQNVFYWKWEVAGSKIKVSGQLNNEAPTIILCNAHETKKKFATLYHIIDEIEKKRLPLYTKLVDSLSDQLVQPFANEIEKANSIELQLDTTLLNLPIEFLKVKNSSIATFRPMVFRISSSVNNEISDTITLHKGLIIRDPTADPENACIDIYHQYPASELKSAYKTSNEDLRYKAGTDFILISTHGDVDSTSLNGSIYLKNMSKLSPAFFKRNNPGLVYIDACQQGINKAYISALAETQKPNFYIAPIISNDSGESSTKTIKWFFSYLKQTHNPVIAIWQTRQKLYKHYYQKLDKMDAINKSFIFRIYKL